MSRFGSSNEDDPIPLESIVGHQRRRTKATVEGTLVELDIVKQKLENCYELLATMQAGYAALARRFDDWETQRVVELQAGVGGGTSSPDDEEMRELEALEARVKARTSGNNT